MRLVPVALIGSLSSLLLFPERALAWGENAHQLVTQAAFNRLPASGCLQTFYSMNGMALLQASIDPDALRDVDPDEGPRHYLDIDVAGNPAAYPRDLATSVMLYGAENGTVPWVTERVQELLIDAFVAQDVNDVVVLSGYLSHYASDASSPFHTTIHYDGQATGNPGIHDRYESQMIDANFAAVQMQLATRTTVVAAPADVSEAIHDVLQTGWPLVAGINATDVAANGRIATLWAQRGSQAVDRMAGSASLVAALWQAAYAAAGTPRLTGMPASCGPSTPADAGVRDTGVRPDTGVDAGTRPDAAAPPPVDSGVHPDAAQPGVDAAPAEDAAAFPPQDTGTMGSDDAAPIDTVDAAEAAPDAGVEEADGGSAAPDASNGGGGGGGGNGAIRSEGCAAIGGDGLVPLLAAAVLMVALSRRRRA